MHKVVDKYTVERLPKYYNRYRKTKEARSDPGTRERHVSELTQALVIYNIIS